MRQVILSVACLLWAPAVLVHASQSGFSHSESRSDGSDSALRPPTPVPLFDEPNCSAVVHRSQTTNLREIALERPSQYEVTNTSGDYVLLTPCTAEPLPNCSSGDSNAVPAGYAAFLPANGTLGCTEIYTKVGSPTLYSEQDEEFTSVYYTSDLSHGLRVTARCNKKLEIGQQEATWLHVMSDTTEGDGVKMKHLSIEARALCPRIEMPPVPTRGADCDADWYKRDIKMKSSLTDWLAEGSTGGWFFPKTDSLKEDQRRLYMAPCGEHSTADKRTFVNKALPGCPSTLGYMAYWNATNQTCVVLDGRIDTIWNPNDLYYKTVYTHAVNFSYDMNVSTRNYPQYRTSDSGDGAEALGSGSSVTPVPPTPYPTVELEFFKLDPIVVTVLVRCGEGKSPEATVEHDELNEKTGVWETTLSFTDVSVCGESFAPTPMPTLPPPGLATGAIAGIMIGVVAFLIAFAVCVRWRMMKTDGELGGYDPVN